MPAPVERKPAWAQAAIGTHVVARTPSRHGYERLREATVSLNEQLNLARWTHLNTQQLVLGIQAQQVHPSTRSVASAICVLARGLVIRRAGSETRDRPRQLSNCTTALQAAMLQNMKLTYTSATRSELRTPSYRWNILLDRSELWNLHIGGTV